MAEEDTSQDAEDNPEEAPEDTPDDTPTDAAEAAEAAPEEAPEDTPEEAPEDTPVDTVDPVEDPGAGDGPEVSEPAPAADASGPPRRPGRTAAIAVGAALAIAAVAVGAAWAIVAIADDDDRSARHEQSFDADEAAGGDDDRRDQFDRDRQERRERAQRERDERLERLEELKREREERSGRIEELKREWQERRLDDAPRDGSAEPGRPSTEECRTILSLGEGDDALTVLICNLPQAEPWQFERRFEDEFEPDEGFEFRRGRRDLAPLFEMFENFRGFEPFRGLDDLEDFFGDIDGLDDLEGFFEGIEDLEDLDGFEGFEGWDGIPWRGRNGWSFGRGQWPFGADGDGGFPGGGRGFWSDLEDGDRGSGIERRFCFGENGEMSCFGDGEGLEELGELSEEQQRELEEWMESFRRFGPGRLLEDILKGYLAANQGPVA